ncbi:MAG: O-antigen ligase family protein [Patescibacteria group bacterium]
MNTKTNYLDTVISIFIIAALVLVPVYFTTDIQNSFTIEKHVIFRFCVLVMLGLSVAKYIYYPVKINLPKLFWLLPVFWLIALLSTIFSVDPTVSLWGIHLRLDGLSTTTFLAGFFVLLYFYVDSHDKIKKIIWAIALGSVIPVLYALAQKIGFDPLSWKDVVAAERVFGTTGNPAYLGAYLMFIIPSTFYLATTLKNKWRHLFWSLLILQTLALIFTWTRAAYLGFFVILFILLFGYLQLNGRKLHSQLLVGIYGLFIIFVLLLNFNSGFAQIFAGNRYIARLSTIGQVEEGTAKDRLTMWNIAVNAIGEHPVLGTGQGSYYMHFNAQYPNYMDSRPEKDRYSNYPHNLILDYGVSFGLSGIIILLSIILSYLYAAWRRFDQVKSVKHKLLLLSLSAALFGYFVQGLFNIDTIITWLYFYAFLALILAAVYRIDQEKEILAQPVTIFKQFTVTIVVIACLAGINYLAINPARADKNYLYINYDNSLTTDQKIALAETAQALTPYYEYTYMKLSDLYLAKVDYANLTQANYWYEEAIEQIDLALKISPHNYKNYLSKGLVLGNWARIDTSKLALAEAALAQAEKLSPDRLGLHYAWGNMYLDLNMIEQAATQFNLAENLNPDVGETYYHQAKIAFLQNNITQADALLKEAKSKGYVYTELEFYQTLATTAYNLGNITMAAYLAEQANSITPTENIALLEIQSYLDLSQPAQAKTKATEYVNLLPALKDKLRGVN